MNEDTINLILEMKEPSEFIKLAEEKAMKWENISNSRLRKVYDYVLKIKKANDPALFMLKPKLAYLEGRTTGREKKDIEQFVQFFSKLIDNINGDETRLKHFKEFFEAFVAYNKQKGK